MSSNRFDDSLAFRKSYSQVSVFVPQLHKKNLKTKMNITRFYCQKNVSLWFGFVLLFGAVVAVSSNSTFIITKFENNPIAYVEKIGESQIVSGDWNLLVYYDLKSYFNEFDAIHVGVKQFEQQCIEAKFDCIPLATQLTRRLCSIQEKNEILLTDHGDVRSKRQIFAALGLGGLAVGGGALYTWLTKSEGNDYAKAIEDLKQNQNRMFDLFNKQTSVIEMTTNLTKENFEKTEEKQKNLRDTINALAFDEKNGWQLHNVALQYSIMLESYADTQNRILDAVTTVHNGNLGSLLIPLTKMREQINLIRSHLGSEFELPQTLRHIYQMANVKVRLVNDKLIFRVAIPVLKASKFQMWRIVPIPQALNDAYMEIRPTTEFLLVSDKNETYYDLTKMEFNACSDIDDRLICRIRHPSYKFGNSTGRCEMGLVRNATLSQTNCQMRRVLLEEKWTQLNDIHSWIFVLDKERNYNLSCDEFTKTITLSGMGLLQLNGNCSFEGETMEISTNHLETKMITGYVVSSNISMHVNHTQAIQNMPLTRIDTTALDVAMQELKKESKEKLLDISVHDWHQYGIIYGLILLVIILYATRKQKKPEEVANINQISFK